MEAKHYALLRIIVLGIIVGGSGWLIKTDSSGHTIWKRKFEENHYVRSVQETSDGGYILIAPDDRLLIKIGSIRAPQNTEVLKNSTNYLESEDQEPEKVVPTSITYQDCDF